MLTCSVVQPSYYMDSPVDAQIARFLLDEAEKAPNNSLIVLPEYSNAGGLSDKEKELAALSRAEEMKQAVSRMAKEKSCYICNSFEDTYQRYLDTFFYMYAKDDEFRTKIKNSKGFCLPHFRDLCVMGDAKLSDREKKDFYEVMLPLMEKNMERLSEDVSWLVEKFDYNNFNADWKNSKDAVQRGMQKLKGGYPADLPYKYSK